MKMFGTGGRPRLRWLVLGLAAVLAGGGGATAAALAATTEPELPPRSAEQLLVELQNADVPGFSGTVVQRAELGLPMLPGLGDDVISGLGSLLSGSSTLRVWYAGPEQIRVARSDTLGQMDVIRDGNDVWAWQSSDNTASHWVLPESADEAGGGLGRPAATMTPQELAESALAALDPTTEVTTSGTAEVAGRSAYELILTPRDPATKVAEVRLAIDAEHGVPLRFQLFGEATEPAVELRFTHIEFTEPDPEQFRFNPPPGATVTEEQLPGFHGDHPEGDRPQGDHAPGGHSADWSDVTVVGEGWTSVLVLQLPEDLDLGPLAALGENGFSLSGTVFSVLLTEDGRVLIGSVSPERLAEVAAG